MHTVLKRAAITGAALATVVTGALAGASPAAASGWHCNTSSRTIDNPGSSNLVWFDNWTFTVKICAMRDGGYLVTYVDKFSWDAPYLQANHFDSAHLRLYLKRHKPNDRDPVVDFKTGDIESRLERDDGSTHTSGIGAYISKGLGDFALKLDWDGDGEGVKHYSFTGTPVL